MLQKQYRLPHSVRLVQPTVYNTEYFSVRISKNNIPNSRFGFIVSKKIDRRAVVRNRIKRVIRSCIEKKWVTTIKGLDMLFVLKKSCIGASYADVSKNTDDIMEKIKNK